MGKKLDLKAKDLVRGAIAAFLVQIVVLVVNLSFFSVFIINLLTNIPGFLLSGLAAGWISRGAGRGLIAGFVGVLAAIVLSPWFSPLFSIGTVLKVPDIFIVAGIGAFGGIVGGLWAKNKWGSEKKGKGAVGKK